MKKGQDVSLSLENKDDERHNLHFRAPEAAPFVNVEIPAEESVGVSFQAPKRVGEYAFYCRFHRDQGMTGMVVVTE